MLQTSHETIPISHTEIYGFADLAAGTEAFTKAGRARQTVVIGARDHLDRWFIVEAWAGRITPTDFKLRIIEACRVWKPIRFGMEANGMQVLFGSLVRDEAKRTIGTGTTFMPIYPKKGVHKQYRIKTGLQPVINDGRLFISDKVGELAQEIRGFPTAATKDLVDSVESMINSVAPKLLTEKEEDVAIQRYASYLRSTRCPAHQINMKVEEYRKQMRINKN